MTVDYQIRRHTAEELSELFGSATEALNKTGGSYAKASFYMANPDQIARSLPVRNEKTQLSAELTSLANAQGAAKRAAARQERAQQLHRDIAAAWNNEGMRGVGSICKRVRAARPTVQRVIASLKIAGVIRGETKREPAAKVAP